MRLFIKILYAIADTLDEHVNGPRPSGAIVSAPLTWPDSGTGDYNPPYPITVTYNPKDTTPTEIPNTWMS